MSKTTETKKEKKKKPDPGPALPVEDRKCWKCERDLTGLTTVVWIIVGGPRIQYLYCGQACAATDTAEWAPDAKTEVVGDGEGDDSD